MYIVVFRSIVPGIYCGTRTWSTFQSKAEFEARYDNHMKTLCAVVEKGVTQDRAIELCSGANPETVGKPFALGYRG